MQSELHPYLTTMVGVQWSVRLYMDQLVVTHFTIHTMVSKICQTEPGEMWFVLIYLPIPNSGKPCIHKCVQLHHRLFLLLPKPHGCGANEHGKASPSCSKGATNHTGMGAKEIYAHLCRPLNRRMCGVVCVLKSRYFIQVICLCASASWVTGPVRYSYSSLET